MSAAPPTRRRLLRRPTRRAAIVIMAIAAAVVLPCGYMAYSVFRNAFDGPRVSAPGHTRVHLESGRWLVYEATGTQHGTGPVTFTDFRGFTTGPQNIEVHDPTGLNLSIGFVGSTQTITKGSHIYTATAEFRAPAEGDYDIALYNDTAVDVMVARPVSDSVGSVALWAIPTGLGLIALILGFVFALVPARDEPPRSPAFGPPPGWYPDQSNTLRWWDGRQWTEHTHR